MQLTPPRRDGALMILLEIPFLLGLAVFCAVGWAHTSRRLAATRRIEQAQEQAYQVFDDRVKLAEEVGGFGTWAWNPSSKLFALSKGAAVISGLGNQPREITGEELYATVHTDDRAAA